MTESRADRIHKSENARQRRKTVKDIVLQGQENYMIN